MRMKRRLKKSAKRKGKQITNEEEERRERKEEKDRSHKREIFYLPTEDRLPAAGAGGPPADPVDLVDPVGMDVTFFVTLPNSTVLTLQQRKETKKK